MKILNKICNTNMVNTLGVLICINGIFFGFSFVLPMAVFIIALFGELTAIIYQIKHTFKIEELLKSGKKIYYTSGLSYTKTTLPNKTNPTGPCIKYVIFVRDYITNKIYKTSVTIKGVKHCQEFETILNGCPEIEVIVDDVEHPKDYYINLEELVKYTTCIDLVGIYKNSQKMKCLILSLINIFMIRLAWYFYVSFLMYPVDPRSMVRSGILAFCFLNIV